MAELTADRLKELISYEPDTGFFRWAKKRPRCRVGDVTGCLMKTGYICIRVDNTLYTAHRLAWLYMTGAWPQDQIDHVNGNRTDNRWGNLREATNMENAHNRRKRVNNKSGITGVRRENSKWLAEIKVNYRPMRLGLFDTPEEAEAAYLTAKRKHHYFSQR